MSHNHSKKMRATVVSRPTHVGNNKDYHYAGHLESLVGVSSEVLIHHAPRPDGMQMILVPAAQAIKDMAQRQQLVGAYYWLEVLRQQLQTSHEHRDHFAIPASCCHVTESVSR